MTQRRSTNSNRDSAHIEKDMETWDDIEIHGNLAEYYQEEGPLPNVKARDGFDQRWIRTEGPGGKDAANISRAYNKGWRRRSPETIPSDQMAPTIHIEGVGDSIGISGMVLMERPKSISEEFARRNRDRQKAQLRAVEENMFKAHTAGSGFGAPEKVEEKTEVKTGVRPQGMPVADD